MEYTSVMMQVGIVPSCDDLEATEFMLDGILAEEGDGVEGAQQASWIRELEASAAAFHAPGAPMLFHSSKHLDMRDSRVASHTTTVLLPFKRFAETAARHVGYYKDFARSVVFGKWPAEAASQPPRPHVSPTTRRPGKKIPRSPRDTAWRPLLMECTEWARPRQERSDSDELSSGPTRSDRRGGGVWERLREMREWPLVTPRAHLDKDYNMYRFATAITAPDLAPPACMGGGALGIADFKAMTIGDARTPSASSSGIAFSAIMDGELLDKRFSASIIPAVDAVASPEAWSDRLHDLHTFQTGRSPTFWPAVSACPTAHFLSWLADSPAGIFLDARDQLLSSPRGVIAGAYAWFKGGPAFVYTDNMCCDIEAFKIMKEWLSRIPPVLETDALAALIARAELAVSPDISNDTATAAVVVADADIGAAAPTATARKISEPTRRARARVLLGKLADWGIGLPPSHLDDLEKWIRDTPLRSAGGVGRRRTMPDETVIVRAPEKLSVRDALATFASKSNATVEWHDGFPRPHMDTHHFALVYR
jgi:hypothetical protein